MTSRFSKILFVTHDAGIYGASRSLQQLVRNMNCPHIDLMVNRRFSGSLDESEIRRRFGGRVKNMYFHFLPFDQVYRGRVTRSLTARFARMLRAILSRVEQREVRRVLEEGGYDYIHFNSITLHKLLHYKAPGILHVREILDDSHKNVLASAAHAAGVVFIDAATEAPFRTTQLRRRLVLNNPVDMTALAALNPEHINYGFDARRHVVFSVIGTLSDNKGTLFLIEAFRHLSSLNCRLLIVGSGRRDYVRQCREAAVSDPRILFLGEMEEVDRIYRISDYILRGEAYTCIGRTIYEGLYAGCEAIVPGTRDTLDEFFESEHFAEKLHFYMPRDLEALHSILERLAARKITERVYLSNVPAYVSAFEDFVTHALSPG